MYITPVNAPIELKGKERIQEIEYEQIREIFLRPKITEPGDIKWNNIKKDKLILPGWFISVSQDHMSTQIAISNKGEKEKSSLYVHVCLRFNP